MEIEPQQPTGPSLEVDGGSWVSRVAPALTLVFLAPMIAEVLPGATRMSSMFVLPVEMCVWGGGALLIRAAVRHWRLGWLNMLLLALALSVAEEWLIQQTSLAPMVIKIKGQEYARALGVNYVYLFWALVYESALVVFVPISLAELIFPSRRDEPWIGRVGAVIATAFFGIGCFLAWFSWTQIARSKVFHLPPYSPPIAAVLIASGVIAGLVLLALGPFRDRLAAKSRPLAPPVPLWLGMRGALWAVLWYGLVLLAFGISPKFPVAAPMTGGFLIAVAIVRRLPRWAAHPAWSQRHQFAVTYGILLGSMAVGYVGFIGATRIDLVGKVVVNLIAVGLMIELWRLRSRNPEPSSTS